MQQFGVFWLSVIVEIIRTNRKKLGLFGIQLGVSCLFGLSNVNSFMNFLLICLFSHFGYLFFP